MADVRLRDTPASDRLPSVDEFRLRARRTLPRFVFDYIEGGAGAELGCARNRDDLDAVQLVPRPLRGESAINLTTSLAGRRIALPLLIAPMGLADLVRPAGDLAMALAAKRAGLPFIQSGASYTRYEDLPRAGEGPPWYQIYVHDDDAALTTLAELADLGCADLVVTVDMAIGGVRYRDAANHFGPRLSARMVAQSCLRPGWQLRHAYARLLPRVRHRALPPAIATRRFDEPMSWNRLGWLREAWRGRFWIKGLLHPDDAARAVAIGADGIIVSNHGGRQLDAAPSSWRMLPTICAVLPKGFPVLADGAIQSGEDIARAIALGASAVLIGRLVLHALASAGEDGVSALLSRLLYEFEVAMRLLGCATVADLATMLPKRAETVEVWETEHRLQSPLVSSLPL